MSFPVPAAPSRRRLAAALVAALILTALAVAAPWSARAQAVPGGVRPAAVTAQTPGYGELTISAGINSDYAPLIPREKTYEFTATYTLPDGRTADAFADWTPPGTLNAGRTGGSVTLNITEDYQFVSAGVFPVGTSVTFSENLDATAPFTPAGVAWEPPVFADQNPDWNQPQDANPFVVKDRQTTKVYAINTPRLADPSTNIFTLWKNVIDTSQPRSEPASWSPSAPEDSPQGPAVTAVAATWTGDEPVLVTLADAPTLDGKTFTFTYECDDPAATKGTLTVDPQWPSASPVLPVGTTCTITEDVAAAQVPGYILDAPNPVKVTIEDQADGPDSIQVDNQYTPTSDTDTFTITKEVQDTSRPAPAIPDAALTDKTFTFTYECNDANASTGRLEVKPGEEVASPELPVGTQCTITEDVASAQVDGYTLQAPAPATAIVALSPAASAVRMTNIYTPKAAPVPDPSPSESASASPSASDPASSPTPTDASTGATPPPSGDPTSTSTSPSTTPSSTQAVIPTPTATASARPSLARTGASAWVAVGAAVLALAGAGTLALRRRV